jgi:hypothetical protein
MRPLLAPVLSLFAISAFSLSAVSSFAQDLSLDNAASACGPAGAQFVVTRGAVPQTLEQPDAGKALVYVIEDQKFKMARDVTARIGLDGTWLGATRGSSYLSFAIEPGEHHLCADWLSDWLPNGRIVAAAPLNAEAGKTYYLRIRISGARDEEPAIDLDPLNADEAKLMLASSPLSVSHPKK